MNKGYPYTLWNVIYMHTLGCEARGCERGRKHPLGTGVALTGRLYVLPALFPRRLSAVSSRGVTVSIGSEKIIYEGVQIIGCPACNFLYFLILKK